MGGIFLAPAEGGIFSITSKNTLNYSKYTGNTLDYSKYSGLLKTHLTTKNILDY